MNMIKNFYVSSSLSADCRS